MKPFSAPIDDILFTLEHVAGANSLPDWDRDIANEIATHFGNFAENELATLDESGDRQGCRLSDGRVRMPDGFSQAYDAYADQGWPGLILPEALGGQGLSDVMHAIVSEVFSGANHALQMVTALAPGAAKVLLEFGTPEQKSDYVRPLATGEALATMCLTEPGAGSDLSRVRCKAVQSGDGWQITGEKIFISGGDQDLTDRIFHLVLARTSDDGIKGLSLFLCPCTTADGTRNSVSVTRIEEKMGLHASPTCQLAFDRAQAELVGIQGQGLAAMFTMMNQLRSDVALQGVAHAARASDIARSYAAERIQGRRADGSPAKLQDHADVRRMLDQIDSTALAGRALAHLAFVEMERGDDPDLVEFLTPLAKVYCSQAGIRATELAIQVLGGYGYLQEYRLEQTYRDARITSIYEGATGIHERMLVTRLLKGEPAATFERFIAREIRSFPEIAAPLNDWRQMRDQILEQPDPTGLAHSFFQLTVETALVPLWKRFAASAPFHPQPDRILRLVHFAEKNSKASRLAHASLLGFDA